jgi:glycerophosphoryl diester phosphodiesterase
MTSRPAIYAHRFGGQLGPESSRAALERSLSGPVDGFEADVVLSADGEVLACHDPHLQLSTADLSGWAHQYPAAVLTRACSTVRAGRAISPLSCSARCWRSSQATCRSSSTSKPMPTSSWRGERRRPAVGSRPRLG